MIRKMWILKNVNVFALRSNFEKETVPDRRCSIRQRSVTKRVHAHRKKEKEEEEEEEEEEYQKKTVTSGLVYN